MLLQAVEQLLKPRMGHGPLRPHVLYLVAGISVILEIKLADTSGGISQTKHLRKGANPKILPVL